jgi:glycerol-1-phosphatase
MSDVRDLVAEYDVVIFDLDGVLYLGDQVIAGAPEAVARLRDLPVRAVFATNNASRLSGDVADLLCSLGIAASGDDVLTSAGVAAALLADRYPEGSRVLVVGAPALFEEVRRCGLRPVTAAADDPIAVVQGYGADVGWTNLAEACVAIRAGAGWVATNADRTLPSPRGPLPGNGSLVAALATALDRQPDTIVGKPDPGLFRRAVVATGSRRPLVVGDRLDTDIEGARRAGMDSLLVLTGVNQAADVLAAPAYRRPTFVAADLLDGLFEVAKPLAAGDVGQWRVRTDGECLVLSGDGASLDALRALCATYWSGQRDAGGAPTVKADGEAARAALAELGVDNAV